MPSIKEIKGQPTWIDYRLPDLRSLERELRSAALDEVEAANSHEAAIELVAQYLGFFNPAILSLTIETPMGLVIVDRKSFYHIVEKRADARERYVKMAMETLAGPFEVWRVEYDD